MIYKLLQVNGQNLFAVDPAGPSLLRASEAYLLIRKWA
jgi:hypothetical protein